MSLLLLFKTTAVVPTVPPAYNPEGYMISTNAFTATAVSAAIAVDGRTWKRGLLNPVICVLENIDAAITVYVGGVDVDKTGSKKGLSLPPTSQLSLEITYDDIVYIIAASGTPTVTVFLARL